MATPKKPRRKRRPFPTSMGQWFVELAGLHTHSLIIVAVSRIDELLREMLRSAIYRPDVADELLGDDRALGTFSSRIKLAYAMGCLDKKRFSQLTALRKIRNAAAHGSTSISLSRSPFRDLVLLLDGTLKESEKDLHIRLAGACVTEAVYLIVRAAEMRGHARFTRRFLTRAASTRKQAQELLEEIASIWEEANLKANKRLPARSS